MNSFTQIKLTFSTKRPEKLRWLRKRNFNCVYIYIYADKTVNKMFDIDLFFYLFG